MKNVDRLMQVLIEPVISEKATLVADKFKQFIFRVAPDANKLEIKEAVESFFKVRVASVQTINLKGESRRFGKQWGSRPGCKKAFVCLAPGYEINLTAEM